MTNNILAVLSIMRFIYDNIMYAELNTKSDYCQACGFEISAEGEARAAKRPIGRCEIEIAEDDGGKLVWCCPKCGNLDQSKMNVARRT